MKKRTQKKLSLAKDTLKNLQNAGLEQAAGGRPVSYYSDCDPCWTDTPNSFCPC